MVTIALCVLPLSAWATTYISEVAIASYNSESGAVNALQNAGFTVLKVDLDKGTSCGYYSYLGYKTTTDVSLAITGLIFEVDNNNVSYNIGGATYLRTSHFGLDHFNKKGKKMRLYYTRHKTENTKMLTALSASVYSSSRAGGVPGYNGTSLNQSSQDVNQGVQCGTFIYVFPTYENHEHQFYNILITKNGNCGNDTWASYTCDCDYSYEAALVGATRPPHTFEGDGNSHCKVCGHHFVRYQGHDRVMPNVAQPFGDANILANNFSMEDNAVLGDGYFELDKAPTKISDNAFSGNDNLRRFTLPEGITSIGNRAFYKCSALTGDLTIPNSVTCLGDSAFCAAKFSGALTLSNSLETIGKSCFKGLSILKGNIHLPATLKSIGSAAFFGCGNLTGELNIPASVTCIEDSVFRYCTRLKGSLTMGDGVKSIGKSAFEGCSGLNGNLVIPNSVTKIGECAFDNCTDFTGNLVIPNGVTSIEESAFYNCAGMKGKLTLSDNLKTISDNAFCLSGFTEDLVIPKSVTSIGSHALFCRGIKNIFCQSVTPPVPTANSYFSDTKELSIYVPRESFSKYMDAWYSYYTIIKPYPVCLGHTPSDSNPNQCANCGFYLMHYTTTDGTIMENLIRTLGDAWVIESVYTDKGGYMVLDKIPTTINNHFTNNQKLQSIEIPNGVTEICESAFQGCTNLRGNLVIPSSVKTIGYHAFYNCGFNGRLELPEAGSDKNLGVESFIGTEFKYVVCKADTPPLMGGPNGFLPYSVKAVYVPSHLVNLYKGNACWYSYRNIIFSMDVLTNMPMGDVNGDGKVSAADVATMVSIINGLDVDAYDKGDMNNDGKIDLQDLVGQKRTLLEEVPSSR